MKYFLIKIISILLILTFAIFFFQQPAPASTYYVAKNGNDNNPGTEAQPWLTIQKAADNAVASDTVYVKQGTYNEQVIVKNSGSANNWITFAAYPGHTVTVDGANIPVPSWDGLIKIENANYIKFSGFRVINSQWAGFYVYDSSHITIEKNYIYNTRSSGILMAKGNNYIVDGNEIELGSNDTTGDNTIQEIVSIQANVDTFEIKNNYVHDGGRPAWGGEGIDAKNGASNGKIHHNEVYNVQSVGIYVDAWDKTQSNISVFNNRVHSTGYNGIAVSGEIGGTINDVSIYNNLVYDADVGIRIPAYNVYGGDAHLNNIKIINNVIYRNLGGIWVGQYSKTYIDNLIIRNNIVSQNNQFQILHTPNIKHTNIIIDYNLIDGFRGVVDETRGTNYVEGNPQFVDPTNADFHLQSTSPAIDKGSPIDAPSMDFDGNPRPKGAGYDIGAYEYGAFTTFPNKYDNNH